MEKVIYYTGIGTYKNNNEYNTNEFMKLMNNKFDKKCSEYINTEKCKICKTSKDKNMEYIRKKMNNSNYILSKNEENKLVKLIDKCNTCKNKKTKKCNLNQYIEYSGAEYKNNTINNTINNSKTINKTKKVNKK